MATSVDAVSRAPASAEDDGWARLASFDGTALAWRVDGPPSAGSAAATTPVVLCNGIACSDGYWRELVGPLARRRAVVRWDYRGHGRSGRPVDPAAVGVDAVVGDLGCLLDEAGLRRAVLVGHSYGVQVALEASRAPASAGRVAGVVAVAGGPGQPLRNVVGHRTAVRLLTGLADWHERRPQATTGAWRRLWRSPAVYWVGRLLRGTSGRAPRAVLADYFQHVEERDLDVLLAMLASMEAHSAADALHGLDVPLLAVAGDADGLAPLETMTAMAVRARGELIVVPGGTHTLPIEQPAQVLAHIESWLERIDHGGVPGVAR